jgi:hypothetical protein
VDTGDFRAEALSVDQWDCMQSIPRGKILIGLAVAETDSNPKDFDLESE